MGPRRSRFTIAAPVLGAAMIVPLLTGLLPSVLRAQPYLSHTGRWSADDTWPATAVHMALMPGIAQYHSQVLWWQAGHEDTLFGGLWGWTPTSDECSAWPGNSFVNLPILPPTKNIFCAGQSHLADGKVLIAGGTEIGTENGMTHLVTFDPLQQSWAQQPDMCERRWYPTATTLPSGDALITSGSRFGHIYFFGGVAGGASLPADARIHRYGHVEDGEWDPPVERPANALWPSARRGHSAITYKFHSTALYFGGVDTAGSYLSDIWRQDRTARSAFHSDYEYRWLPLTIVEGGPPLPRSEHVAIELKDGRMIVFGGRGLDDLEQETVHADVWALTPVSTPSTGYTWSTIQLNTPSGSPGPLHGHAVVYEPQYDRMYVFGGATTLGGTLASNDVWALHFDQQSPAQATWEQVTVQGSSVPAARFNHTMGFDSGIASHLMRHSAVLFGGEGSGGARFNDVWRMWIKDSLTVEWIPFTSSGDAPSPRADHGGLYVAPERDLVVLGGRTDDDTVYVAVIDTVGGSNAAVWDKKAGHGTSLAGHTALPGGADFSRIPELYKPPGVDSAEVDTLNARLLQEWYPQMFVAPGGLIFNAGPSDTSYAFHLATESWSQFPTNSVSGFKGGSAVQYLPGKVMKCGSRDTGNGAGAPVGDAVATTGVIDLAAGTPAWALIDTMSTGRVNHNLVLLPDGDVLAVGGTGKIKNDQLIEPVYSIERWRPSGAGGDWSGAGVLAANPRARDYHSTALLLPDGRVLSAGGNADHSQYHKANLYCPPYLFRQDGSAASRPVITSAPPVESYGSNFEVTVTTPGGAAVSSVSLLKPGATTHGFDQDQRFLPLSFSGTGTLTLTAPASPDSAPPGDYLLFVLVQHPDEAGEQVPSVAKWIRLSADVTAPAQKNLTVDLVSQTSVGLEWEAPGDDGTTNGSAQQYDVRYSSTPLTESGWASANKPSGEPWPASPGSYEGYQVTGLQPCTRYWFALKTRDEAYNYSTISDTISAKTICSGGGGGLGETAQEVRDESEAESSRPGAIASAQAAMVGPRSAEAASLRPEALAMVVEFEREGSVTTVRLHRTNVEVEGFGSKDPAGITLQVPGNAGWTGRGLFVPGLQDGLFGLMPPEPRFRYVCRGGYDLTHVAERALSAAGAQTAQAATHSTLGDVTEDVIANGAVQLAAGETLIVRYGPAEPNGAELDWFVLAHSTSGSASTSWLRPAPGVVIPRPIEFALHQNQPNPFSRGTTIRFDLPVATQVKLEIFDLQGRRVRTLANARFKPGYHAIEWDHRDDRGNTLRAGIYLYRLRADTFTAQRKMAMVP